MADREAASVALASAELQGPEGQLALVEAKVARAPGRHRRLGAAAGRPRELGKEMFEVAAEGYRVVRRLERPTSRDPAQVLCRPADPHPRGRPMASHCEGRTGRSKFTRLVVDFGGKAVGLPESCQPRLVAPGWVQPTNSPHCYVSCLLERSPSLGCLRPMASAPSRRLFDFPVEPQARAVPWIGWHGPRNAVAHAHERAAPSRRETHFSSTSTNRSGRMGFATWSTMPAAND